MSGKSELLLFNRQHPQAVIERSNWVEYSPITSITKNAPIEFKVISDQYIDLSESLLYVKFNLEEGVGYSVAPVNNILSSAFADMEVRFGEKIVEVTNHMYPYKSLFTILLNYNADAKNSTLSTSGYYEDECGKMCAANNSGFVTRKALKCHEFMGNLWLDTFNHSRFMLPNVSIQLKLTPTTNKFNLQAFGDTTVAAKTEPSMSIIDCKLFVRNVGVNSVVRLAHEAGLAKENAIYPYQSTDLKNFVVSRGLSNVSIDNIFNQKIPKLVVFAMVSNKAFNGSLDENPFRFQHFDCNFVGLYKDGISLPMKEFTPNFENGECVREYVSLMQNLNMFGKNNTNSISFREYQSDGYTFFAYNLAADLAFSSQQPQQVGNIRLDIRFAKPLPCAINIILFGLFDNEFQITENRRIII